MLFYSIGRRGLVNNFYNMWLNFGGKDTIKLKMEN